MLLLPEIKFEKSWLTGIVINSCFVDPVLEARVKLRNLSEEDVRFFWDYLETIFYQWKSEHGIRPPVRGALATLTPYDKLLPYQCAYYGITSYTQLLLDKLIPDDYPPIRKFIDKVALEKVLAVMILKEVSAERVDEGAVLRAYTELTKITREELMDLLDKFIKPAIKYYNSAEQKRVRSLVKFPTPEGLDWEDVAITFISDEMIRIKAGGITKNYDYAEMGFKDYKGKTYKGMDQPNILWKLFLEIAKNGGEIPYDQLNRNQKNNVKQYLSQIRKQLIEVMGIEKSPITWRGSFYKTKFNLSYIGDENSELNDFCKEREPIPDEYDPYDP